MHMHFIKTMGGVSVAALLFSTIGMKILADQASANIPEETTSKITISQEGQSVELDILNKTEGPLEAHPSDKSFEPTQSSPNVRLSEDERAIVRNLLKEEAEAERLTEDMPVNPFETVTLDTPAKRSAARVHALAEYGGDATEWRHDDRPVDLGNDKPAASSPPSKKNQAVPLAPEATGGSDIHQVGAESNSFTEETLPTEIAPLPQEEVVATAESISDYHESPALVPQDGEGRVPTQGEVPVVYKQSNLSDRIVTLSHNDSRPAVIRPNLKVVTPVIYGGDDENLPPEKEEDPDDPTSKGTRRGGQHKGTEVAPQIKAIPIIRMGEYNKENSGLTVIKPWNS